MGLLKWLAGLRAGDLDPLLLLDIFACSSLAAVSNSSWSTPLAGHLLQQIYLQPTALSNGGYFSVNVFSAVAGASLYHWLFRCLFFLQLGWFGCRIRGIFRRLFLLTVTSLRELALLLLELEALLLREAEDTDELLPVKLCRAVKYTQSVTRGSDQQTNHKTKRDNCNSHLDE